MTKLEELKKRHADLAAQFTALNNQIRARKAAVRAAGGTVKTDVKLSQLKAAAAMMNFEIQKLNNEIAAEPVRVTGNTPRAERNRPEGPAVDVSKEIFGMNAVQKRLIMLLAREVGFDRYNELRLIAAADFRHRETEYYTGSKTWNPDETPAATTTTKANVTPPEAEPEKEAKPEAPQRRLAWEKPELTEEERFDRMMRGNYNRYGGANL